MSELPKNSLIALAKQLPKTNILEQLHEDMGKYVSWIEKKGQSEEPPSELGKRIERLRVRIGYLLDTPLGLDLLILILPVLIETSKSNDTPPEEPEPVIA